MENIVAKGEIARFEQFLLLSLSLKSRLLQRRQKVSIWGKGLSRLLKSKIFIIFLMFTFSHVQQICSRRLWKLLGKNMENLFNCRYLAEKNRKHCGKWRNCSYWAISPFVTFFSIENVYVVYGFTSRQID